MEINSISDFRKAIRHGAYAWPGGYPVYFIASDGEAISFKAAKEYRRQILQALRDHDDSGWRVIGVEVNWEDSSLICAASNEPIESAYGLTGDTQEEGKE